MGATYQAAKLGGQLGAGPAYAAVTQRSGGAVLDRLKSPEYIKGASVALLDQWGSKKLGHAAALSRKSVTAILPELAAGADAVERGNADLVASGAHMNENWNGYNFTDNGFDLQKAKPYLVEKYVLGGARKVLIQTRIAKPVQEFLGKFGLAI